MVVLEGNPIFGVGPGGDFAGVTCSERVPVRFDGCAERFF